MDGLQTAREIRAMDENVCIIFVTGTAGYAVQGYEANGLDFLVRPLSYANFCTRFKKALRIARLNASALCIPLKFGGDSRLVRSDEIIYIETCGAYVDYHTPYGVSHMRGPLKSLAAELAPYGFLRCNHCFLVNLRYVTAIAGDMVVAGGERLKISRGKRKAFIDGLAAYLGRRP